MNDIIDIEKQLAADEAALDAQMASGQSPSLNNADQASESEQPPVNGTETETKAPDTGSSTQPAAKDQPKDDGEKPKEEEKPAKELSKYQKAVERQAKSWAKLNEEKAAIEESRKKFDAERQAWESEKAKSTKVDAKPSPEEYEAHAKQCDAEGDFKQAALARQVAAERRAEIATEQAKASQPASLYPEDKFKAMEARAFRQAVKEFPDIAAPNSAFNQSIQKMVQTEPAVAELVKTSPYGLYFVARFAHEQARAARVPDLEKKVAALTSDLENLRRSTSPISDPMVNAAASHQGSARFSDLSLDEMDRQIEQELSGR